MERLLAQGASAKVTNEVSQLWLWFEMDPIKFVWRSKLGTVATCVHLFGGMARL